MIFTGDQKCEVGWNEAIAILTVEKFMCWMCIAKCLLENFSYLHHIYDTANSNMPPAFAHVLLPLTWAIYRHYKFHPLQDTMLDWLVGLASIVVEPMPPSVKNWRLSLIDPHRLANTIYKTSSFVYFTMMYNNVCKINNGIEGTFWVSTYVAELCFHCHVHLYSHCPGSSRWHCFLSAFVPLQGDRSGTQLVRLRHHPAGWTIFMLITFNT